MSGMGPGSEYQHRTNSNINISPARYMHATKANHVRKKHKYTHLSKTYTLSASGIYKTSVIQLTPSAIPAGIMGVVTDEVVVLRRVQHEMPSIAH